jgi:hypothetical protein
MKITLPQITPGPWSLHPDDECRFGITAEKGASAVCDGCSWHGPERQDGLANGPAIAAVPDLLKALEAPGLDEAHLRLSKAIAGGMLHEITSAATSLWLILGGHQHQRINALRKAGATVEP